MDRLEEVTRSYPYGQLPWAHPPEEDIDPRFLKKVEAIERDYERTAQYLELDGDSVGKRLEYAFSLLSDIEEASSRGMKETVEFFAEAAKWHIMVVQKNLAPKCKTCGAALLHPVEANQGYCSEHGRRPLG